MSIFPLLNTLPAESGSACDIQVRGETVRMIWCSPGELEMGTPRGQGSTAKLEVPHHVVLTRGFWIAANPVTVRLWDLVMESELSAAEGSDDVPAYGVSWLASMDFCQRIALAQPDPDWQLTLPSEAQWEYACRAGSVTRWYFGDDENALPRHAWYRANSGSRAHPVGQKEPNPWGIHDLYGNVSEWCLDSFQMFSRKRAVDPVSREETPLRVTRGGSFIDHPDMCRSSSRAVVPKDEANMRVIGLRIAAVPRTS